MDRVNNAKDIINHLMTCWECEQLTELIMTKSFANEGELSFSILEIPPTINYPYWKYVTNACRQFTNSLSGEKIEFFVVSPDNSEILKENLLAFMYFIRNHKVTLGYSLKVGRPWIEDSKLDAFLVSLPYPYGAKFEYCELEDGSSLRFLWLLPIYMKEYEFISIYSIDDLESKFDQYGIDFLNINRPCVI